MKKILSVLAAASLLLSTTWMTSCTKQDGPEKQPEETPEQPQEEKHEYDPDATVKFSQETKYNIGGDGGSVNVIFQCSGYWTLEIPEDASWITSSSLSGEGNTKRQTFKLTAAVNPDEAERKAKLVFRYGEGKDKTQKITVTQAESVITISPSDVPNLEKIYIPQEFRNMDMFRSDSKWFFGRSRQSEHFIVFWDIKYGSHGTVLPTNAKNSSMRVDIDDLLKKAEEFYDLNVNKLKFANPGKDLSVLDKYKMQIYIIYQSEWLATGSGYDNVIGALWVNPSTCKPVGSTIGHEIGHCFQYMTFCDYLVRQGVSVDNAPSTSGLQGPGWRYGFGDNGEGGNAFWEQTAQWQSMVMSQYREETFTGWYGEYTNSTHLHVLHERPRYADYFIHWWWVEQNDITFIGRLWNEAQYPEDPIETYMRLMDYDVAAMNDSMYGYASHMVTYDTEELRKYAKYEYGGRILDHHGEMAIATSNISQNEDWWTIKSSLSPETTGYNVIRMTVPAGEEVSVTFSQNLGVGGCISGSAPLAGWRFGFVAINSDDTRTYSPVWNADANATATKTWTVPENASKVWFVVTGAPSEYERHPWTDESDDKDTKWPWKAQFENTKPYGK